MTNQDNCPELKPYATTLLPTKYGNFTCHVFQDRQFRDHVCLILGDVAGQEDVLCRIHSECLTGEVFGSLKCDCQQQLESAFRTIQAQGKGVIIYLRQEGRGIGLGNKIRAYAMQERGLDTVDANKVLGFPEDARSYLEAGAILEYLKVRSVQLLTNNPAKIDFLQKTNIKVKRIAQEIVLESKDAHDYIRVKQNRMGHLPVHHTSVSKSG